MKTKASQKWIGRWVRFYNAGCLVIGEVEYAEGDRYSSDIELSTDAGNIDSEAVLEWREAKHPKPEGK